jgi:hypothetical protein
MQTRAVAGLCESLLPEPVCQLFSKLLGNVPVGPLKDVIEEPSSKVSLRGEAEHSVKDDSPPAFAQALPRQLLPPTLDGLVSAIRPPVSDPSNVLKKDI